METVHASTKIAGFVDVYSRTIYLLELSNRSSSHRGEESPSLSRARIRGASVGVCGRVSVATPLLADRVEWDMLHCQARPPTIGQVHKLSKSNETHHMSVRRAIAGCRAAVLILTYASSAQSPQVELDPSVTAYESAVRDCRELEQRTRESTDVDGIQLLFVRPPLTCATLEQLVKSLELNPQGQLLCIEACRSYCQQTTAVHTGPIPSLRLRMAELSAALSADDSDAISERCGSMRSELLRLNRLLKSHEARLFASIVAQEQTRGARAAAVHAYQQEVRLSQSVPSPLKGALVDIVAFLALCQRDGAKADPVALRECDAALVAALDQGIALHRERIEVTKDAHCEIARAQSNARIHGSGEPDAWEVCRQAGKREHRANLAIVQWNRLVVEKYASGLSAECATFIRARLSEIIFPTVYPDPTTLHDFQARLFETEDASFDREAVRLILADAERQRREICAEMEKQAQLWSETKASELGGNDWWQQHCDTFAALALRRWMSASSALSQIKTLVAPSETNRSANSQLAALIAQRDAELFESATIRPDSDIPVTLKLTRTTVKSDDRAK